MFNRNLLIYPQFSNCLCILALVYLPLVLFQISTAQVDVEANGNKIEKSENSIEQDLETRQSLSCGTTASNLTSFVVKNPNYPQPTYIKAFCETVVERVDPNVSKLNIKFRQLELYRSNYDGTCLHDRFAVYTDLNLAVTPIICGNQTGKNITVPFMKHQTSLIVSIVTSDLDHDRLWVLEIEQA